MNLYSIILLGIVQGLAELLPVSSSAHVILVQRLLGLDPSAPEMTFLLVMLHTGTMFAVILYFWPNWKASFLNPKSRVSLFKSLILVTAVTGVIGLGLKVFIEKVIFEAWLGHAKGEVESLFKILPLMAGALLAAGVLILYSGLQKPVTNPRDSFTQKESIILGIVQGLCLPFRGFSRSGATISTSILQGKSQAFSESFSFALAVILTPPVILLELRRLLKHNDGVASVSIPSLVGPAFLGLVCSFVAGLVALKFLSALLEKGRWKFFGYYCIALSALIFAVPFFT